MRVRQFPFFVAIRSLPLVLAYLAFPLAAILLRAADGDPNAAWFRSSIDIGWCCLLQAGVVTLLCKLGRPLRLPRIPVWSILVLGECCLIAIISIARRDISFAPYLMELKPFFYLAVALVWASAFGLPNATEFVRIGSLLSCLIACELVFRSLSERSIVHPLGSGEVNYDACLIALSLCFGLASSEVSRLEVAWLFIGVLATFSRTGAITALSILFLSPQVKRGIKLLSCLPAGIAVFLSFQSRALELAVTQIDRYIMWVTALQLFSGHPFGLLFGYGVGGRLPAEVPPGLDDLWRSQTDNLGLTGVFAFEFHAMWLRLLITWGIFLILYIAAVLTWWILQRKALLARYVAILIAAEAFTMGLFYLSNVAVPAFLLVAIAARQVLAKSHHIPEHFDLAGA